MQSIPLPPHPNTQDIAFRTWVQQLSDLRYFSFPLDTDDLLPHMVALQLPLPTPLHPRAVPPGQPQHVPLARSARQRQPRWLRWQKAGQRGGGSSARGGQQRRHQRGHPPPNVLARSFPQRDGYSVGDLLTEMERDADDQLVAYTVIEGEQCRWKDDDTRHHPYDLLYGASRGLFGTTHFSQNRTLWYNRWFPLAMFLAHRYEMALRSVYDKRQHGSVVPPPPVLVRRERPTPQLWRRATVRVVQRILLREEEVAPSPTSARIRESLLWGLLQQHLSTATTTLMMMTANDGVTALPMLHTPLARFHALVYQEWHTLWTDQQMRDLLVDEEPSRPAPTKKGNKKKKRKQKQRALAAEATTTSTAPSDALASTSSTVPILLGTVEELEPTGSESSKDDDETDTNEYSLLVPMDGAQRTIVPGKEGSIPFEGADDDDDGSFQKVERNKRPVGPREPPVKVTFRKPRRPKVPPQHRPPNTIDQQQQRQVPAPSNVTTADDPRASYMSPPRRPAVQYEQPSYHHHHPQQQQHHHHGNGPIYSLQSLPPIDDPTATIRTSNVMHDAMYGEQGYSNDGPPLPRTTEHFSTAAAVPPSQFYHNYYTPWGEGFHPPFRSNNGNGSHPRNESILSELFVGLHTKTSKNASTDADLLSTAASIASSSGSENNIGSEEHDHDHEEGTIAVDDEDNDDGVLELVDDVSVLVPSAGQEATSPSSPLVRIEPLPDSLPEEEEDEPSQSGEEDEVEPVLSMDSPSPPSTPSPTLSPIFVSLSDISAMKESIDRLKLPQQQESVGGSEKGLHINYSMSSPPLHTTASHDASCSSDARKRPQRQSPFPSTTTGGGSARPLRTRDDQEIKLQQLFIHPIPRKSSSSVDAYRSATMAKKVGARDDHDITLRSNNKSTPRLTSCRTSVGRNLSKADQKHHYRRTSPRQISLESSSLVYRKTYGLTASSSETALDCDDYQNWHDTISKAGENHSCNDGAETTPVHTSSPHQQFEIQSSSVETLREERNMYQDMCLTLGAEVATLRALLAAQKAACAPEVGFPRTDLLPQQQQHPYYGVVPPQLFPHTFPLAPRAKTLAAMSDTGYRGGEHESLASEDEIASRTKLANQKSGPYSSAVTLAESDASLDQSSTHNFTHPSLTREFVGEFSTPHQSVRSRLGQDIYQLMELVENQLKRLSPKRQSAIERMTRLVKTQWPRAQVSLYGSHATGLCVPNSDLDFVISLPAVHKKAVAVAPGALEGRNAINETSQKQLARHLKGESWIDPRSMKLIDRTFVPVIKVATKDTKAKTLHLDISFEGPGHHGLEAARMISTVVDEFPVVRPLVIVLKLLLIDRSLLESYSGGLSSYCLFLMVTKYVQEQDRGLDVGAMLMGFLDFHGNHYFARPNNFINRYDGESNAAWRATTATAVDTTAASYVRRNSATGGDRRPRLQTGMHTQSYHSMAPMYAPPQQHDQSSFDSGMPYTFDPLFVEDPLSDGNNVGRNAFRIFQVQRALSDAHRALVAALEWEREEETDEQSIPLLKGLFQNDGAVYDLQV